MKRATREWVRKAEADYRLAEAISRGDESFHDQLCFHCQQAAEKYLKALLEEHGQAVPCMTWTNSRNCYSRIVRH